MNKVHQIGRLTRDPRFNKVQLGTQEVSVCNFAIAVNEGTGENQTTTYFNCVAWRGLADVCAKYLTKGRQVFVEGPVHLKEYTGTDGKTHPYMEIRCNTVEFLGANPANHQATAEAAEPNYEAADAPTEPAPEVPAQTPPEEDDLPF